MKVSNSGTYVPQGDRLVVKIGHTKDIKKCIAKMSTDNYRGFKVLYKRKSIDWFMVRQKLHEIYHQSYLNNDWYELTTREVNDIKTIRWD